MNADADGVSAVGGEGTEAAIQWLLNDCADVWFHDGYASAEIAVRGVLAVAGAQGSDLARALADALSILLQDCQPEKTAANMPCAPSERSYVAAIDALNRWAAWDTQEARDGSG